MESHEDDPDDAVQRLIDAHRFRLAQKQAQLNMEPMGISYKEIGRVLAAPWFYLTPEQGQFIDSQMPPMLAGRQNPAPMKGETLVIEPTRGRSTE